MSQRSHRLTTAFAASVLAAVALAPAVLAQDASPAPAASAAAGGASGKHVVVLMPTTTNTYIAEWARGAQDEAAKQGMTIDIIENNFDQAEQNTQAQQQINAGTPPDAYVWWPADNNAGVATLQALAATGVPVIQTNQLPAEACRRLMGRLRGRQRRPQRRGRRPAARRCARRARGRPAV